MSNVTPLPTARLKNKIQQPKEKVKVYLCGTMRAVAPAGENILPRARKTRALLAYLCVARDERVRRSRLGALLWDRSGEGQARLSLRHALTELNAAVRACAPGLIEADREMVRLNASACWIDIFAERHHSERLLDDLDGISNAFDLWLASERARFEDQLRGNLEAELNQLIEEQAPADLVAAAARNLVNSDPTNEAAVRALMTSFTHMGERVQAIREYERCRSALRSMLDIAPSNETVALYEAIRLMSRPRSVEPRRDLASAAELEDGRRREPVLLPSERKQQHDRLPSIAVLPFQNLSADPRHQYAADGLVEDLIEALSRVPGFFVISRLSTLVFRNQDRLPQEIGELLGVRYVLSGSMRIVDDRLRLTVELTDTRRGVALWLSKVDEQFFDLLEVQHRLAAAIVSRVAPYLYAAELQRARTKRPESSEAHDLFLRAQENMHNSSRTVFETSEQLFGEAIKRDPNYAPVLAWRAYWHVLRVGQGWSPDPAHDARLADHFARRAVECDALEPMALAVRGHIASYLHKNFDQAFQHFESALRTNPNAAPAWLWSAAANAWLGDGSRAIEEINRAMALSPYDPLIYAYSAVAGMAYLADCQFDRALEYGLRSLGQNRTYTATYKLVVLALSLADREQEARPYLEKLLKLEPGLTVERYRRRFPGSAGPLGDVYCDGLARAGLPPC